MILNEFEAVTNSANRPIIFTYYDESALSRSSLQYIIFEEHLGVMLFARKISKNINTF